MTKLVKRALLLAVFGLVLVAVAAPTAFAKPCWKVLIDDWYDGRIDGIYSIKCYREAKKRAPEDLTQYSDLPSDLTRALSSLAVKKGKSTAYVLPGSLGRDAAKPRSQASRPPAKTVGGSSKDSDDERNASGVPDAAGGGNGPIGAVFRATSADRADEIPLPLIALASLALLLIGAGAAGLVTKRVRARRMRPGPTAPDG